MRTSLLLLGLLAAPAVLAQSTVEGRRAVDLQLLGSGLNVNGVGLRFWVHPNVPTTVSITGSRVATSTAAGDATTTRVAVQAGIERHVRTEARVHPYVSASGLFSIESAGAQGGALGKTTGVGGRLGLGAEARLFDGLSLSGEYGLSATYLMGENDASAFALTLGGAPRVALSLRF